MNRIKIKHPTSILKQLAEHKIFKSKACDWGKVNEKAAVTLYESSDNVKVTTCGLVINPRWPWLGCSPDGLLDDRTIEINWPYKWRDTDIYTASADKNLFMALKEGVPKLKARHHYYYQCQGVMAITETNMIDFVVYFKNEANEESFFVETINFDSDKWNNMLLPELTKFYFDFVAEKVFQYSD